MKLERLYGSPDQIRYEDADFPQNAQSSSLETCTASNRRFSLCAGLCYPMKPPLWRAPLRCCWARLAILAFACLAFPLISAPVMASLRYWVNISSKLRASLCRASTSPLSTTHNSLQKPHKKPVTFTQTSRSEPEEYKKGSGAILSSVVSFHGILTLVVADNNYRSFKGF